ncbi:uncharacterized protein LOC132615556 [Lycium barbarum]|uniref:uncharacterized protein LOC132615556 n=1 Tax=Lycium barbarum TaxID=112863 RepID=UPI00293F5481|nr:uncharacterized protein LOC132615556 [Lycium barbarum]XP_060186144.1 uncharacterized protein LOC132615556 [Lycium barbarum]
MPCKPSPWSRVSKNPDLVLPDTPTSERRSALMAGLPNKGIHIADEGELPSKLPNKLKQYPSFCRNGTTITVNSFAIVMAKEESHCLGYLEDFYGNKKGQKKLKCSGFNIFRKSTV